MNDTAPSSSDRELILPNTGIMLVTDNRTAPWWTLSRSTLEGMVLDIVGTKNAGQEWLDGKLDGRQAQLITLTDGGSSVALVRVLPDGSEEHRVPIKYLKPHEAKIGEFAVLLSGPHTGERGPVVDYGGLCLDGEGGARPLSGYTFATCVQQ